MAQAFDTLGFAKHLASAKVPQEQAEAIAEAIRDKVMIELATKTDIERLEIATRADIQRLEGATRADIQQLEGATRADIQRLEGATRADIQRLEGTTRADIQRVEGEIKRLADQITIRLGGMLIVGFGIMAALLRFFASA